MFFFIVWAVLWAMRCWIRKNDLLRCRCDGPVSRKRWILMFFVVKPAWEAANKLEMYDLMFPEIGFVSYYWRNAVFNKIQTVRLISQLFQRSYRKDVAALMIARVAFSPIVTSHALLTSNTIGGDGCCIMCFLQTVLSSKALVLTPMKLMWKIPNNATVQVCSLQLQTLALKGSIRLQKVQKKTGHGCQAFLAVRKYIEVITLNQLFLTAKIEKALLLTITKTEMTGVSVEACKFVRS